MTDLAKTSGVSPPVIVGADGASNCCQETPPEEHGQVQGVEGRIGQQTRQCTICGESKANSEFYRKRDGLDSSCKLCKRARQRRYRQTQMEGSVSVQQKASNEPKKATAVQITAMSAENFQQLVKLFTILKRWREEDARVEVSNSEELD